MSRRIPIAVGLLACAAVLAPLVGCGSDDGLGKRYTITGKVTYNGEPLKKGSIVFVPEKSDGRGASGQVVDGEIRNMTTQDAGDGVLEGKYLVGITAMEDVDLTKDMAKYQGGAPDPVSQAKIMNKAKKLIPEKYATPAKSGLTAEVSASSRTFDFPLKD
jgi:hypothetical protein